ncbi:MAG: cobalamin biosynthesis protein CobD [Methanomassiliicoccus sp.]|nr:cobalamin biosynthesis protein CobD [Methanomassiliicoccus sp.]
MDLWLYAIIIPLVALVIDLALGEPPNRVHPVVWMGRLIGALDGLVKRDEPRRTRKERALGVLVILIPILVFVLGFTIILALTRWWLGMLVWAAACAIIFKTLFAIRALETHTAPMVDDLMRDDLDAARKKASMVVSRDVNKLDRAHVISCAAETVSENLVDSVLSPMFYFGLAGIPGAAFLRVANTGDGMIGYLSEKHRYVGWFTARLDDCAHYLVARLSVPFIMLSLALLRKDWRNAWRTALRDHHQTSSPNKGWPMASVAGGLHVRFEKVGYYNMGDGEVSLDPLVIRDTIRVMKLTAVIFFVLIMLPLFTFVGIHVQLYLEDVLLGMLGLR